jgi:hypothetical protein
MKLYYIGFTKIGEEPSERAWLIFVSIYFLHTDNKRTFIYSKENVFKLTVTGMVLI